MIHKGKSVFKVIVFPLVIIILLQAVLFCIAFKGTGVTKAASDSSLGLLKERSANQTRTMEHNFAEWGNLDDITDRINLLTAAYLEQNQYTYEDIKNKQEAAKSYLEFVSDSVIGLIKSNSVTGAFMILNSGGRDAYLSKVQRYNAIYFRSSGQLKNGQDDPDFVLERGPKNVAEVQGLPIGSNWKEDFLYNPLEETDNMEFFMKPLSAAYTYPNQEMSDLGYWAPAFNLNDPDKEIAQVITYAQPLWDEDRDIYAMIGIEISVDMLREQFQSIAEEETAQSYYLVSGEDEHSTGDIINCTVQFPLVQAVDEGDVPEQYKLSKGKEKNGLYQVEDVRWNKSAVYGKITGLSVYRPHSPLADRQWAILTLSREDDLFRISRHVTAYMLAVMLFSVLVGLLVIYFIAAYIDRKIRELTLNLTAIAPDEDMGQQEFSFQELNRLEQAVIGVREQYQHTLSLSSKEKERYLIALESSADAVFEYDCEIDCFVIYQLNKEEGKPADLKETRMKRFLADIVMEGYCRREDVSSMTNFLHGRYIQRLELQFRTSSQEDYSWIAIRGRALCDKDNKVRWIIGNIRRIDEAKEKELQEQENNSLDRATKLFTNEAGESRIRKYLSSKRKEEGFSLCMIDLNQFQALNDCYGFLYGDILIEEVGELLRRYIHNEDIGIRMGGDEFIIFLKEISKEETFCICQSICRSIERMYIGEGEVTKLTCSIGFVNRTGVVDFENLLRYAGSALCEIKKQGRQSVGEYFELREEMENCIGKMEFDANRFITKIMSLGNQDSIVFIANNIFEKTVNFKSAFKTILKKAGFTYELSRILVINTDVEHNADYIEEQWCRYGMEPFNQEVFHYEDEVYEAFLSLFDKDHVFVTNCNADNKYPPVLQNMMHYSKKHPVVYYALYDKDAYIGYIQFKKNKEGNTWKQEEVTTLKQLAGMIAVHYIRNKRERFGPAEKNRRIVDSHE